MGVLVAPSVLSADFANISLELQRAEAAGADWIHVDVMDGQFVPNITVGLPVVRAIGSATKLPIDCHLMIVQPDRYIADFASAGASHLIVHAEACTHLQRSLTQIRAAGMKSGVALNPATDESCLTYVLNDLDSVLVMSVNPGFGGQQFLPAVLPKIARIRRMLDEAGRQDVLISVDGGIDPATAPQVVASGARVLVAGKSIYGTSDVTAAVAKLRESCEGSIQRRE